MAHKVVQLSVFDAGQPVIIGVGLPQRELPFVDPSIHYISYCHFDLGFNEVLMGNISVCHCSFAVD